MYEIYSHTISLFLRSVIVLRIELASCIHFWFIVKTQCHARSVALLVRHHAKDAIHCPLLALIDT